MKLAFVEYMEKAGKPLNHAGFSGGEGRRKLAGVELLAEQPRLTELLARLAKRPSIARVTAEAAG